MTDEQQKRMANKLIPALEGLLRQARVAETGEEKIKKLNKIKQLIDEGASFESLPVEWMELFGPGGLSSPTTVLACGWFRESRWHQKLALCPGTRRVFKNREVGKHAEVEMLEWLTSTGRGGRELRIVVSRAPCEECLKKIMAFQEINSVTIRIGFTNWYHRSQRQCSNSHQLYESTIDQRMGYTLLTQMDMKDRVFSPLFGSTLPLAEPPDWKFAMEQAWEDCWQRTEYRNMDLLMSSSKIDNLRLKMLNKRRTRMLKAIRIMLKLFGVRFAFWKWQKTAKELYLIHWFASIGVSTSQARKYPTGRKNCTSATKSLPVSDNSASSWEEVRGEEEVGIALERCKIGADNELPMTPKPPSSC